MAAAKNQSITDGKVVQYHYSMKGPDGKLIESSRDPAIGEPVAYLHGSGEILSGLEAAMSGRKVGEKFTITVSAADAFGERAPDDQADQVITRDELGEEVEVDDPIIAMDEDGEEHELWVKAVKGNEIVLTHNHPLSGIDITFEIEVLDLRDANEEEQEAGAAFGWSGDEPPFGDDEEIDWDDEDGDEDEDEDVEDED